MAWRWGSCGALILVMGVTACSSPVAAPADAPVADASPSPTAAAGPVVPGMAALAYRTRVDDAAGGRFQIKLTNTGSTAFTVVSTALDSPGFAPLAPAPRETFFGPGARIDMPTPYGAVDCAAGADAEPAFAALDVVRPDGTRERVRVPMPSDHDTLARIHTEECLAVQVARAVGLSLVDLAAVGSGPAQVVRGSLELVRGDADGEIAVTDLRGSVLYDVGAAPGTDFPRTMPAGEDDLLVPVEIGPATCESHVIAETKKPFVFPVFLALDGAEPVFSEIPVTAAQRDLVYAVLVEACDL